MKKMLVLMAGLLAAAIVNAGNIVDAEDMKVAKDITFDVKSLEYKGDGNIGKSLIPELLRIGYKVRALEYQTKVPEQDGRFIKSEYIWKQIKNISARWESKRKCRFIIRLNHWK